MCESPQVLMLSVPMQSCLSTESVIVSQQVPCHIQSHCKTPERGLCVTAEIKQSHIFELA